MVFVFMEDGAVGPRAGGRDRQSARKWYIENALKQCWVPCLPSLLSPFVSPSFPSGLSFISFLFFPPWPSSASTFLSLSFPFPSFIPPFPGGESWHLKDHHWSDLRGVDWTQVGPSAVHPMQWHTESCPLAAPRAAAPKAQIPFRNCINFCPPKAIRSQYSFGRKSTLCSVLCMTLFSTTHTLVLHLQHCVPSVHLWAISVCLCPHWFLSYLPSFILSHWTYIGSAYYIISSNQSCPNISFIIYQWKGVMITKYFWWWWWRYL